MEESILYIVATPIGNLNDISFRAIETLREVDFILCEDTRVTRKLLERYQIKKRLISYHQYSGFKKIDQIIKLLEEGKQLALVSDAGTPGISDPGNELIKKTIEALGGNVQTIPVPGPSALAAAASIAGFSMDRFLFLGFSPRKKKRKKFFEEIARSEYPIIFFESPYRIIKTLNELREIGRELHVVLCRELTKKFETVYRGTPAEIISALTKEQILGEFVVITRALGRKKPG